MGKPALVFYPPDDAPRLLKIRMEALLGGEGPNALITMLRRFDGAFLPVEMRLANLDGSGELPGRLVCVHRLEL